MARPRKQGLDYFPLDVSFYSDVRIICIGGEFGPIGELVSIRLLCLIYSNAYYISWDDGTRYKMLRELPGLSSEMLDKIVARLVQRGLFDKTLFEEAAILTSREIQKVYFEAVRRRKPADPAKFPYLLKGIETKESSVENEEAADDADNKPVSDETTEVSVDINATNKTKPNKTKPNKKTLPPQAPPAGEQARQGAESGKEFLKIFLERSSDEELEPRLARLKLSREQFEMVAGLVVGEWDDDGVSHGSYNAAVRHLFNHIRKKLSAQPSLRTTPTPQQRLRDMEARRAERATRDASIRAYDAEVAATGLTGWQRYCAAHGLDPARTSAAELAAQGAQDARRLPPHLALGTPPTDAIPRIQSEIDLRWKTNEKIAE